MKPKRGFIFLKTAVMFIKKESGHKFPLYEIKMYNSKTEPYIPYVQGHV